MNVDEMMQVMAEAQKFSYDLERCAVCKAKKGTVKLAICSGCKSVAYCGSEHQSHHWKERHKADCKNHAKLMSMKQTMEAAKGCNVVHSEKGELGTYSWVMDSKTGFCSCVSQFNGSFKIDGDCKECKVDSFGERGQLLLLAVEADQLARVAAPLRSMKQHRGGWRSSPFTFNSHRFLFSVTGNNDGKIMLELDSLDEAKNYAEAIRNGGAGYRLTLWNVTSTGMARLPVINGQCPQEVVQLFHIKDLHGVFGAIPMSYVPMVEGAQASKLFSGWPAKADKTYGLILVDIELYCTFSSFREYEFTRMIFNEHRRHTTIPPHLEPRKWSLNELYAMTGRKEPKVIFIESFQTGGCGCC